VGEATGMPFSMARMALACSTNPTPHTTVWNSSQLAPERNTATIYDFVAARDLKELAVLCQSSINSAYHALDRGSRVPSI
jgi:hypothetical protein